MQTLDSYLHLRAVYYALLYKPYRSQQKVSIEKYSLVFISALLYSVMYLKWGGHLWKVHLMRLPITVVWRITEENRYHIRAVG